MGSPGPASSKSTSAALAVLLVGWIIANLIRRILTKTLTRVRFEQLIERSGLKTPLSRVGVKDPSRLMATLIYWAAMLLVLQLAIDTFGESAIQGRPRRPRRLPAHATVGHRRTNQRTRHDCYPGHTRACAIPGEAQFCQDGCCVLDA